MLRKLPRRAPGLVIALVALAVVAMSGSAVAGSLVTSKQIKNGTIKYKDMNPKARAKLQGDAGPQGLQGAPGAPGAKGEPGEPGPSYDRLVPVSAFVFTGSSGEVTGESHRAPMTGAPTVTRVGAGDYTVDLPGIAYHTADDVATCTTDSDRTAGISSLGGSDLKVYVTDSAGASDDPSRIHCVVHDLG